MSGKVESSRSAGVSPALLSRQASAIDLQSHSPLRSSRMRSNSLKTNDGCHVYPSQNPEADFPGFGSSNSGKNPSPFFHHAHEE